MIAARKAVAAAISACLNNFMNRILRASMMCVWYLGVNMSLIASQVVWLLLMSDLWVSIVWYVILIPVVHEFVGSMLLLAECSAVS